MPRLDHQRHQKGRHRRKAAQKQRRQHEFQRAAVHYRTHQGRQPDRQAQRLHIDAVAEAQHQISGKHRQRLRRCGPEGLPDRSLCARRRSYRFGFFHYTNPLD